RACQHRQAQIDRIAEEDSGSARDHDSANADHLERDHRLLARGARSEIAATDKDVAEPDPRAEVGIEVLEAVGAEFGGISERKITTRQDGIGVHVITESVHASADHINGTAHRRSSEAGESAWGGVILP